MRIFCTVVGVEGNAFSVEIDEDGYVENVKVAIKKKKKYQFPADEMQLFLAKSGDWAWMADESDAALALENGMAHPDIQTLTDKEQLKATRTMKDPLVETAGAIWDFQNPLDGEDFPDAIRGHYVAWKDGKYDKKLHPLFTCMSGPGTGKSRVLDEFPTLVKECVFAEKEEDSKMRKLLQNAFTFKISFENGRQFEFSDPALAIGTRMLYQFQDTMDWNPFAGDKSRQVVPSEVFTKLSKMTDTAVRDMCVILCVDNLQCLNCESGTDFHRALCALSDIVNASRYWVIAICSTTVSSPVYDFLALTSQWIYQVPMAPLSRPTVKGEDIFAPFKGNKMVDLLITDMGGFGGALEILSLVLKKNRSAQFLPVLTAVLSKLRVQYPGIEIQIEDIQVAFLVVIARRRVNINYRYGSLSLDEVISTGLFGLERNRLTCPYVLYLLLDFNAHPSSGGLWDFEIQEKMKPWQSWDIFNCKFRALKLMALVENNNVRWDKIHQGAHFGTGTHVTELCANNHVPTQYPRRRWLHVPQVSIKVRPAHAEKNGRFAIYQPAAEDPSSTAFTCVKDVNRGFFHEVHQCKAVEGKLSLQTLKEEKDKATSPNDLFVLYCTGEVDGKVSWFKNCVVVHRTCWEEYYGPFAARALFVNTVARPCLNNSPGSDLELVEGISPAMAELIVTKRIVVSYEDAHEHKKRKLDVGDS